MPAVDATSRLTEEQIEGMRRQYGRIKHLTYNGVELVFRKPKPVEVEQHAAKLDNPAEKPHADNQLAQLLVVWCNGKADAAARDALLELRREYPYAIRNEKIGGALAKLTGIVEDEEVKSSESD